MAAEFDEARIEEATKKASRMRLLLKVIRCKLVQGTGTFVGGAAIP